MPDRSQPTASAPWRTFFALPVPDAVKREARRARRLFGEGGFTGRYTEEATWHITVRFLGATPPDAVPGLLSAAARAAGNLPAPRFRFRGWDAFPSRDTPRVVVLAFSASASFRLLADALDQAARRAGLDPDRRPPRPHVTVLRVDHMGRWPPLRDAASVEFPAAPLVLYRSTLHATGAEYTVLGQVGFAPEKTLPP